MPQRVVLPFGFAHDVRDVARLERERVDHFSTSQFFQPFRIGADFSVRHLESAMMFVFIFGIKIVVILRHGQREEHHRVRERSRRRRRRRRRGRIPRLFLLHIDARYVVSLSLSLWKQRHTLSSLLRAIIRKRFFFSFSFF